MSPAFSVHAAPTTPFDGSGDLDFDALGERLAERGVCYPTAPRAPL
jgi:hypothetical protein